MGSRGKYILIAVGTFAIIAVVAISLSFILEDDPDNMGLTHYNTGVTSVTNEHEPELTTDPIPFDQEGRGEEESEDAQDKNETKEASDEEQSIEEDLPQLSNLRKIQLLKQVTQNMTSAEHYDLGILNYNHKLEVKQTATSLYMIGKKDVFEVDTARLVIIDNMGKVPELIIDKKLAPNQGLQYVLGPGHRRFVMVAGVNHYYIYHIDNRELAGPYDMKWESGILSHMNIINQGRFITGQRQNGTNFLLDFHDLDNPKELTAVNATDNGDALYILNDWVYHDRFAAVVLKKENEATVHEVLFDDFLLANNGKPAKKNDSYCVVTQIDNNLQYYRVIDLKQLKLLEAKHDINSTSPEEILKEFN